MRLRGVFLHKKTVFVMSKIRAAKWMLLAVFCLFCLSSQAAFGGEPLQIAISYQHPPYHFKNHKGIRCEIIASILDRLGREYIFHSFSLNRSRIAIETVDMDISLVARKGVGKGYFSDPYIYYSNVAVSLKKNNYSIESVQDLKNHVVYAWQGASKVLGDEFAEGFPSTNEKYHEIPRPPVLPQMLYLERTEVILIDKFVFSYLWNEMAKEKVTMPEVVYHNVLPSRVYFYAKFKDEQLRDEFNVELAKFKAEGGIQEIYERNVPNIVKADLVWDVE